MCRRVDMRTRVIVVDLDSRLIGADQTLLFLLGYSKNQFLSLRIH